MIVEAANLDCKSVQVLGCTSHICKVIFPKTVGEPSLAVLGAEHNMVEKGCKLAEALGTRKN